MSPRRRPSYRRWLLAGAIGGLCVLLAGAGAGAAVESDTVGSVGDGLLWAVTLMTTAGFLHGPPATVAGAVIAVVLMVVGFLLLSLASAALAAIFVQEDVEAAESHETALSQEILRRLEEVQCRLDAIERSLPPDPDL